jgi:hypothetical protein
MTNEKYNLWVVRILILTLCSGWAYVIITAAASYDAFNPANAEPPHSFWTDWVGAFGALFTGLTLLILLRHLGEMRKTNQLSSSNFVFTARRLITLEFTLISYTKDVIDYILSDDEKDLWQTYVAAKTLDEITRNTDDEVLHLLKHDTVIVRGDTHTFAMQLLNILRLELFTHELIEENQKLLLEARERIRSQEASDTNTEAYFLMQLRKLADSYNDLLYGDIGYRLEKKRSQLVDAALS